MSWFNNGDWDGATVQDLKSIISQLCTAVNEREAIKGVTETTWIVTTGPDKKRPDAADFSGMDFVSESNDVKANISALHVAIRQVVETTSAAGAAPDDLSIRWADKDTLTTYVQIGDVPPLGGGDFPTPDRVQNKDVWLLIKDVLDELRTPLYFLKKNTASGGLDPDVKSALLGGPPITTQHLWDNVLAATPVTQTLGAFVNQFRNTMNFAPPPGGHATVGINATHWLTANIPGTLVNGWQPVFVQILGQDLNTAITVQHGPVSKTYSGVQTTDLILGDQGNSWPIVGSTQAIGIVTITSPAWPPLATPWDLFGGAIIFEAEEQFQIDISPERYTRCIVELQVPGDLTYG